MKILAVNFGHDASLAGFVDGRLVAFEELERTTRHKHQLGVSADHIEEFLSESGIRFHDVDFVGICSTQGWNMRHCDEIEMAMGWSVQPDTAIWGDLGCWPSTPLREGRDGMESHDAIAQAGGLHSETPSVFSDQYDWPYLDGPLVDLARLEGLLSEAENINHFDLRERLKSLVVPFTFCLRGLQKPGFYVDHHACHAYYAHFYSGAEKSIVCTHDGGAPLYPFNSGGIYLSSHSRGVLPVISHNLGLGVVYDQVCIAVGLEDEPGKLMGLASYANPSPTVFSLVEPALEAFSTNDWGRITELALQIVALSKRGAALKDASIERFPIKLSDWKTAVQTASNTQLLVQCMFTTLIGRIATGIMESRPDFKTVDLTGGFTFNCPSNQMLQQQFPALKINPLPAAGDTGLPIGAATLICHLCDVSVERKVHKEGLIAAFPPTKKAPHHELPKGLLRKVERDRESVPQFIARQIVDGKVICLYRGRSEVGPRALGHRSIIAHAVTDTIRDRINRSKGRELWRPLAPICREEDFHEYFDGDPNLARYMLFTFRVLGHGLPAVTHVDGTARVQCVTRIDNWLHPALKIIKELKQHPVIINTSFNCAGEPLVETMDQAARSFVEMQFDYLVTEIGVFCPASEPTSGDARSSANGAT